MTTARWLPLLMLLVGCAKPDEEATIVTMPPEAPKSPPGVTRDVPYGEGPSRVLDLFIPVGAKGEPLVVFVHGGAWQGGSRREYDPIAAKLQAAGFAVATVDYRLSPAVRHPAHAEDVAHAFVWLRAHSGGYGYDASKAFLVGHSAGAHIAATIATDPTLFALAKPAGFVGLEGIYDVPDLANRWPTYPNWFLDNAFGKDQTAWAAASPTRLKVVGKAPWLLVHSKADELVDAGQTDDFARHLREAGVRVEVVRPEGESHDGVVQDLAQDNEAAQAIRRFVRQFHA